jgi:hypothetical protein
MRTFLKIQLIATLAALIWLYLGSETTRSFDFGNGMSIPLYPDVPFLGAIATIALLLFAAFRVAPRLHRPLLDIDN